MAFIDKLAEVAETVGTLTIPVAVIASAANLCDVLKVGVAKRELVTPEGDAMSLGALKAGACKIDPVVVMTEANCSCRDLNSGVGIALCTITAGEFTAIFKTPGKYASTDLYTVPI
jgi:hypothetical protein